MKIAYVVPGPMHLTEYGEAEMQRRKRKLEEWAFAGTTVDVVAVERGPASIESNYEEYLSIQATAEKIVELEAGGYDASIVGCFGDPGLDGLREITEMLVVGPAASSMTTAVGLGHSFGIVTVTGTIVHSLKRVAWDTGLLPALACIKYIDVPVLELNGSQEESTDRMIDEGREALQEGADVLVLGCMTMGFLGVETEMSKVLGVPVLSPARAALKTTESLVSMGFSHSKRAYPSPPKIGHGNARSIGDLLVG